MTSVPRPQRRRSLLADPVFRLLWGGEPCAHIAEQLFIVCLTLLVLDIAGPGAAVGAVLAVAAVPRALLLPVGGVLADRVDPARIVLASTVLRTASLFLLAALVLAGAADLVVVAVLAGVLGLLDAVFFPAAMALLPRVAAPAVLPRANTYLQAAETAGDLFGPAVAAVLVAGAGAGGALGTVGMLYVVASCLLAVLARRLTHVPRPAGAPPAPPLETPPQDPAPLLGQSGPAELRAGLRYAWGDPVIRTALLVLAGLNVAVVGPVLVGAAVLAEQRLGGPHTLGLVFTGFGIGSALGLLAAGTLTPSRRGAALVATTAMIGAGTAGFALAGGLVAAMATAAVIGAGSGYLGVVLVAWLQQRTPADLQGRVMSLVVLAVVALDPLSYALAGALLPLGLPILFGVSGALVLTLAALAALTPTVCALR